MKSKKSNKSVNFSLHVKTELCDYHGMEVCIGELDLSDLSNIYKLISGRKYFESAYYNEFYNYSNFYHKNGILINDGDFSENEFNDNEKKSSSMFHNLDLSSIDFDNDTKIKNKTSIIEIPAIGIYLYSIRNESIYLSANGTVSGKWKGPLELICDNLPLVGCSIFRNVSAEGKDWMRFPENEEADGSIFGTHQFLIVDGEVLFFARTLKEYPFGDASDYNALGDLEINFEYSKLILKRIKQIIAHR